MQRIFTISILIILASCSSVKTEKKNAYKGLPKQKVGLKNLTVKATISPDTPDFSGSLSSKFDIAGKDSLKMQVFAPFGIEVARIFSSEDFFLVYNVFEGNAFKGKPTPETLEKFAQIKLSFRDFISFTRSEVPGDPNSYRFEKELEGGRSLYRSKQKGDYLEFVTLDPDANVLQYQQMTTDGKVKLNVFFEDYKMWGKYSLAGNVIIKLPDNDMQVEIEVDEYSFPDSFENFSIEIPSEIEIKELDK